jgi:ParB/RepB/Spo0J family partition protein
MTNTNFKEIPLDQITPSPMNPRKVFSGDKLAELVLSISQKGVIEPIIVRPIKDGEKSYEIVAGGRRFHASSLAKLQTIPAIVRDLTDDEAYDFVLIENLQREDLTDREEAESFKAYIGRHGDGAIQDLAEKTGISQGYIRARVHVLELPTAVLKAWEKGDLTFGHLRQLLRVTAEKELKETIDWALQQFRWERTLTIKELAQHIDGEAPALSWAFFKTKEICAKCPSNSTVQKDLFDIETGRAQCLNPTCFKKHQGDWLTMNWKKTSAIAKKEKTNGFRFREDIGYDGFWRFYEWKGGQAGKKCHECPDFVTVLELSGKVDAGQACAGKKECYNAITNPKSSKEQQAGERDPEAPRAAWHGEYFRDVFLSKRIPEVLAGIDPDDPKVKALLLVCAVHGNRSDTNVQNPAGLLAKSDAELRKLFKNIIQKIVLSGQHVGQWGGFGTGGRRRVAEYLGIDLAKEFAVDTDYLDKKTKAEILAFCKKSGIFKHPKAQTWLKGADPAKLKKSELVDYVLKSGVDLVGRVPSEILK